MQTAQNLDALRASHAVEVAIKDAMEVDQIFDAISVSAYDLLSFLRRWTVAYERPQYLKGSSVIRMLVAHLGIKDFLQGIAAYLKKHAYGTPHHMCLRSSLTHEIVGNAKTVDLWAALSEASGKDVTTFMVRQA